MIYKMDLKDSSDTMTFNLLETPIVDKDIEGAVDNVTLDGNQYTDYLYLKKQYIQKWAIMCPDEYDELRGFYTRQFEDGEVPSYRVYYGANVTRDYTLNGDYFKFNAEGIETGMTLSQLLGNAEQTTYSGKNLLPSINTTRTRNGVTFTHNDDGSISLSGTATADTAYPINVNSTGNARNVPLSAGNYIVSGGSATSPTTVYMQAYYGTIGGADRYSMSTFTLEANGTMGAYIYVKSGTNTNGKTIYPIVEAGSTATSYEPYVGGTPAPNPEYPQPISVVTGENVVKVVGKNLFDYASASDTANTTVSSYRIFEINGLKPSTIYTMSNMTFTAPIPGTYIYFWGIPQYPGTPGALITNGSQYTNTKQYDSNSEGKIYLAIFPSDETTWNNTIGYFENAMLVEGTETPAYEPYQGQTLPVNLGKNLFDTDTAVTRFENIGGSQMNDWGTYQDGIVTIVKSNGAHGTCAFAGFKPTLIEGETYTLSATIRLSGTNATNQIRFGIVQNSPSMAVSGKDVWLDVSRTFVATATDVSDSRVDIQAANTGNIIEIKNIQLEKGSATSYAPYFTPIELAKIGNYQDRIYKNDGKWYIEKQVGKVVLDGSNEGISWSLTTTGSSYSFWYRNNTMGAKTTEHPKLCDRFTYDASPYTTAPTPSLCENQHPSYDGGYMTIFKVDSTIATTINEWKTWLASNPTTVYYALATPTTTEITNETLLLQLNFLASLYEGENNISLIGTGAQGEMEVFIRDVMSVETDVVPEVPVRLTLTDDGVINACGCRRNVQLTMRETTE